MLGALLDAGTPVDELLLGLKTLPLSGWDLKVERVRKGSIVATSVSISFDSDNQPERRLSDIEDILTRSQLPDGVKEQSLKIFRLLAEAEAKVHGVGVDEIHFHEIGAVDSIIDIVGTIYSLHLLGVHEVYASPLPFSRGRVETVHGELPVPAPATIEILQGIPVYPLDIEAELVTPTGAALLKALAKGFGAPPPFTPMRVGYGAGKKDLPFPNILRVIIGETLDGVSFERERLVVVEANLDDMTGELAGFVMERLLEIGAKDVWITPAQMKKSRPAIILSVLCNHEKLPIVLQALFRETTTLGVRIQEVERLSLPRESWEVMTPHGTIRVKVATLGGEIINIAPEYEDCQRLALEKGLPLKEIFSAASIAARKRIEEMVKGEK